jgi:hypothetical protein
MWTFPSGCAGNLQSAQCNNEGEMRSDLQQHLDLDSARSRDHETWRRCGNSSGGRRVGLMTEDSPRLVSEVRLQVTLTATLSGYLCGRPRSAPNETLAGWLQKVSSPKEWTRSKSKDCENRPSDG